MANSPLDWMVHEAEAAAAPFMPAFAAGSGGGPSVQQTEKDVDQAAKDTSSAAKSTSLAAKTVGRFVVGLAIASVIGIGIAIAVSGGKK